MNFTKIADSMNRLSQLAVRITSMLDKHEGGTDMNGEHLIAVEAPAELRSVAVVLESAAVDEDGDMN